MRFIHIATLPLAVNALNLVMSNDDGWAEINIRTFYKSLTAAGHKLVLSAPAENKSGSGSSDSTPTTRTDPCEFNSCPANSPATGFNASDPRLNYVNSYPVTSIKYGITTLAPKFFNGAAPDLAVTGPNVGTNVGIQAPFSGTVGAAVAAAEAGIPAIAFSGLTGDQTAWNATTPLYSQVYADLALNLTNAVIASGKPYLPAGVFLNVNFPASNAAQCSNSNQFKFVLTRIYPGVPIFTGDDVATCGRTKLPWEGSTIAKSGGCYVAVSDGDAADKTDADATRQAVVLSKLKNLLTCLPS